MTRIPGLRRAFRPPWRRAAAEVDEEFAFHLDMRARELVARGWLPAAAAAEARRQFGDVDDARAYCRHLTDRRERRGRWRARLGELRHDLALAVRALRRSPGFTLAAVATLALGIGANVTMLGVVDRLLVRPPAHVADPGTLRRIYFHRQLDGGPETTASTSWPQYRDVAESMRSARAVAAYYDREAPFGEGDGAWQGRVSLVTPDYLRALGARPALGRDFRAEEDLPPSGVPVAILSHALRQRAFPGVDPLGREVQIAGRRFRVIGVMPPGFTGIDPARIDAWVPMSTLVGQTIDQFSTEGWQRARNVGFLRAVARVHDAGALARDEGEATTGFRRAIEARGASAARLDSLRPRVSLEPLLAERGPDRTPNARIAVWLAGMSAVVLCIACANVANLLLARAVRRRRESAVRMALGAGRRRLVTGVLGEALLLGALGGAGAVAVAHWGGMAVRRLLLPDAALDGAIADPRMLALGVAVALGAGLLTGLVPAAQAGRLDLSEALHAGARDGGGRRARARDALVVVQSALSLVLLAGAGLFVQSLRTARALDLGFEPRQVLAVRAYFAEYGDTPASTAALAERLRDRLARLPGVESATLGVSEPFNTTLDMDIGLPGRDSLPPTALPVVNAVTPDFFRTMGTRLVRGRGIEAEDRAGAPPVVVVNETMARTLWPGRDALGQCVLLEKRDAPSTCATVVGIAEDAVWRDIRAPRALQMYLSLPQGFLDVPLRVIYLRTRGEPAALVRAVRHEVRQAAPRVLLPNVEPLAMNLEPVMRPWRLGAAVFTAFGGLALVLAALGLYAVVSYDAAQRTREMGVRLALGAQAGDVLRLVVGSGLRVAAVGVGIGVGAALFAGRWLGPMLFGTTPYDPRVLGGVTLLLLAVAAAAGAVPGWRATRIGAASALREE